MQAGVKHVSDQIPPALSGPALSGPGLSDPALAALGWSAFFSDQLGEADAGLVPMRVATVHRARMTAQSVAGPVRLTLPPRANTADYAVGDWILTDGESGMLVRRLDRQTLLQRRSDGGGAPQLIAANVDTLFIVTSCNDDFSPARLERYLAVANEAGTTPVIVLSKADKIADPGAFRDQAVALQRGLQAVWLDATSPDAARVLAPWLGTGQTVALVGSSGVGKSSLLNTLAEKTGEDAQLTGSIREDDAKGRHTTTSRSLHAIAGGAMVIDTPGIRSLYVSDLSSGLDQLFAEIAELTPECRFRDCTHGHEPGCAVQAAVKAGTLDPARLDRWRKLHEENLANTPILTGPRGNKTTRPGGKRR
ncbi:ribosome small subunit-dependent GTPase A [Pseudomonas sp. GX19020]|uniref:ribosome small subunit-dependent GTPase A n=1 Tax=Pseudomonas sp. GX19020 TaxID=2942277 RepID=UPI0020188660|nr:ribosome small subunit-dependent GTPase A [Pseudomonas sp. GX19020]MCL4065072.1 ribosome small subunit-dependent GTPase A [Pseudomonas sp. GX19020]